MDHHVAIHAADPLAIANEHRRTTSRIASVPGGAQINEDSLRKTLRSYFSYYHDSRCHQALNKDSPESREVQSLDKGRIIEISKVGGLHHRYERRAA